MASAVIVKILSSYCWMIALLGSYPLVGLLGAYFKISLIDFEKLLTCTS